MPISQERMIGLTNAALDYQQAFHAITDFINDQVRQVNAGQATAEEALTTIATLGTTASGLLNDHATSQTTIALESRHWLRTAKRNERERGRLQRKREAEGVVKAIHDTSPKSLAHSALRRDESILQATGVVRPRNDYQQRGQGPIGPRATGKATGTEADPVAMAGARLSAEARAAIDREITLRATGQVPGLTGDMASDIAADLDDPSIPQAPEVGDGDD